MSDENLAPTQDESIVPQSSTPASNAALHTEQARVVREQVIKLTQDISEQWFDLGKLLEQVRCGQLWRGDYESFDAYIEEEVGFSVRKAQELIKVTRCCQAANVGRDEMVSVGWSKLAIVAGDLTKQNATELLAGIKHKTCRQLKEAARQRKADRKKSSHACRPESLIVTEVILEALRYACLHTRDMDLQTNLEFVAAKFLEHCPSPARVAEPSLN